MFVFLPLESRREERNGGSDSARALEIACAKELMFGKETGGLGGEAGVLTGEAGVEPLPERGDAVNRRRHRRQAVVCGSHPERT